MLVAFEEALKALNDEGFKSHQEQWMPRVKDSWDALIQSYQLLTKQDRNPIDYSASEVQAAYIYAYAMPRAYFTHEMLRRHRQAIGAPLLPKGKIRVVSLGGGPASELVGLLEYLGDAANGEVVTGIYGKQYQQPRLVSLYADKGKTYDYSGISLHPLPWTDLLREIRRRVQDCTDAEFNAVFLNLYRDHNDSMGFHSDDERELGKNPLIASVTFGATRIFLMKHKIRKDLPLVKIPLEAGSVLLMRGQTQHFWKHGINKQSEPCGPRVNLTFRTLYS